LAEKIFQSQCCFLDFKKEAGLLHNRTVVGTARAASTIQHDAASQHWFAIEKRFLINFANILVCYRKEVFN
jgi:hypothetical protein